MHKQLSVLGDCIINYKGEGILTLQDDFSIACTFEVGQLKQGDIFLFCDCSASTTMPFFTPARKFEGTTTQGHTFTSLDNLACTDSTAGIHVYLLQEGTICMAEQTLPQRIHYGITNLIIKQPLHIQVKHKDVMQQIIIKPVHNYETIMWQISRLKSIDVTCEIIGEVTADIDKEMLDEIVSNLCNLLSVAKGTKIEWIYRDKYNAEGSCIEKMLASRITKAYCPLYLIKEDKILQIFLEKAYSAYVRNRERYALDQGTIDAYLDAKAESDYLQIRGIKLAVTMEILKDVFLKLSDTSIQKVYINPNRFNKKVRHELKNAVLPILQSANSNITPETVNEKLQDLNRRSFKEILEDICKQIDLALPEEDTRYFIKSRDELIHTGLFKSENRLRGTEDTQPLIEEFHILMNILDKMFLRLLEYHGYYIDRRVPNKTNQFAQI